MRFSRSIPILFLLHFSNALMAQSFEGIWKGTSLCQVKNSPCHDEVVVYYISKDSTGKSYNVNAYKIIDGKEDFMGTIKFSYDAQKKDFVSIDTARNAKWEFKLTGDTMKGTLVSKGNLFRIVELKREK